MTPTEQDLGTFLRGDTVPDQSFTVLSGTNPVDINGQTIKTQFRFGAKNGPLQKSSEIGSGITVTDAVNGEFNIDSFQLQYWPVGTYYYDIQFNDSGTITTRFSGTIVVEQDVTE